ncbi:MAG: riboflavin kinase [Patescibacteria group bacterium]
MKHIIFWGKVNRGKQRGRLLGFPTANMRLHRRIPEGIYLSYAILNGKEYPALTFIGSAKTFGEDTYQAEVYILNQNFNLYNKVLRVKLLKKIRGNQKFNSKEDLVAQMKKDREVAQNYFSLTR